MKSSTSGLGNRDYRPRGSVALTTRQPLPSDVGTNLAGLDCPSVGIVRLRIKSDGVGLFFTCRHD
jgi:hypothetical protein